MAISWRSSISNWEVLIQTRQYTGAPQEPYPMARR
jgi:hypothetical protein